MADDPKVPYVNVLWQGKDISASVIFAEVEDHDLLIDRAIVELDDNSGVGGNLQSEGQTLKIDMGWNGEHGVLFEGLVQAPKGKADQKGKILQIVAYDVSQKLHREYRSVAHTGALSKIITDLVTAKQIEIGKVAPDPDPTFDKDKDGALVQTNETDLQLIQRMARRYRARAFVEYNEGKSKFYFIPVKEFLSVKLGRMQYCHGINQLIDFEYHKIASKADSLRDDTRTDPYTGQVTPNKATPPDPPDPPKLDDETTEGIAATGMSSVGDSATTAAASAPEQRTDLIQKRAASGRASDPEESALANQQDPTRAMGLFGKGTVVGTINLRAKGTVQIEGIAQWVEGDWYVGMVKHIYKRSKDHPLYQTKFVATR